MRIAGLIAFLLSLAGFATAAYDQWRGIAEVRSHRGLIVRTAKRVEEPAQFQQLMSYEWTRATILFFAGVVIRTMARRADESDPMHPDFKGDPGVDESDQDLRKELERRRRGF